MIDESTIQGYSYETAFWMAGVFNADYPLEQLGELTQEVCAKLRAIACFHLLKDGGVNSFYHNLIRSGRARAAYLKRCMDEVALEDHFRASGRYAAVCDCVAANDSDLAVRIIELSPAEFMPGHEYEDDYCYAQLLHGLVTGREGRASDLLAQLERYLDGAPNGRYLIAKSLTERRQGDFNEGFEQLLKDRQQEIASDIERGQIESPHIVTARRVFVEGLAILRFAEKVGLQTEEDYLFCPSIARIPMTVPFPGE